MNPDGTEPFEDHDPIEEAAVGWLIERDEGFAPGRAAEFERWRSAHPAHVAAVERLEETWGILEELPSLPAKTAAPRLVLAAVPSPTQRFRAGIWLPLAAAAMIVLAFGWWRSGQRSENANTRYATTASSVQCVELPDGSVVTLNASSEASVQFSPRERRVVLAAGEAHFDVAHDVARPFLVTADGITVRAVGTAFNVRVAAAAVEVVVASGKVRLLDLAQTPALAAAPLLEAGDRAVVSRGSSQRVPAVTRLEPQQLREVLAWQHEMLVFADTPLREVIAQFNRHNRTQLRLGDTDLGARLIGGTFAVGNVAAFVTLLERGGDLAAERHGEHEIILRKAR